jgi:hypothetical protein
MAVVQISRIQHRRGLQQDLPNLSSAELGWSVDERRLYIGNGTTAEGAPVEGRTEILTEHTDILALANSYTFKGLAAGFQVVTGVDALHPIVRTLQDKLDDYVSVKDFGAIGNGVADDTAAIQRALERTYGSSQSQIASGKHRTIYFPAGTYRVTSTINVPPYSRLQGEGKRSTSLEGSFDGPIAQFADSAGQVGVDFGAAVGSVQPEIAEYHFSDMSFIQKSLDYDQSCLVIDGGFTATFNRVMFRGMLDKTTADYAGSTSLTNPVYNVERASGVAGVCVNNNSENEIVRNLVFTQCDFMDQNYGIELNNGVVGISVTSCFFDHCYHHIVAGNNTVDPNAYTPYGISVYDNYHRYSAKESLRCYPSVNNVMSLGNIITAAGLDDYESNSPINNPDGLATSAAIKFEDNNNFSIADSFDRNDLDYALFPNIDYGSYNCYIVGQDLGIVNGRLTTGRGNTLELVESATTTSVGLKYVPSGYNNLKLNYVITHDGATRTGEMRIVRRSGAYYFYEDYTETGDVGVEFNVNGVTGIITYTSSVVSEPILLTSNIEYLN